MPHGTLQVAFALLLGSALEVWAQIDPYPRNLLQLGYDYSLSGKGPQSLYAYFNYNNPAFRNTNIALRLAVAPVYLDGEIGFRRLLSPHTDAGLDYLPGFAQRSRWQTGVGTDLFYTSRSQVWRVIMRYGYGVNALRDAHEGAHSVGLLHQYTPEQRKHRNETD